MENLYICKEKKFGRIGSRLQISQLLIFSRELKSALTTINLFRSMSHETFLHTVLWWKEKKKIFLYLIILRHRFQCPTREALKKPVYNVSCFVKSLPWPNTSMAQKYLFIAIFYKKMSCVTWALVSKIFLWHHFARALNTMNKIIPLGLKYVWRHKWETPYQNLKAWVIDFRFLENAGNKLRKGFHTWSQVGKEEVEPVECGILKNQQQY